jgi:hypothetical protein
MPYVKGDENTKKGGRKKGSIGKKTAEFKEFIADMLQYEKDNREEMLEKIKRENPSIIYNMLARVCPKDINLTSSDIKQVIIVPSNAPRNDE